MQSKSTLHDAIKRFRVYHKSHVKHKDRQDLPTMDYIIQYCEKYPRLLTLRDSPLSDLHDPSMPATMVHDWYIAIALDYVREKMEIISPQWEAQYLAHQHDVGHSAMLYSNLMIELHSIYSNLKLTLDIPCPEHSAMASELLKARLHKEFCRQVQQQLPPHFGDTQRIYYARVCEMLNENGLVFAPIAPIDDSLVKCVLQAPLDDNIPELADLFCMSNAELSGQVHKALSRPRMEEEEQGGHPMMESWVQQFIDMCQYAKTIQLAPSWVDLVRDMVRSNLEGQQEDWQEYVLAELLDWLRSTVLPWLSFLVQEADWTQDENWFHFLRAKIRAEHIVYEEFYRSRAIHLFDIIREHPTSLPVLEDLKLAINKRNLGNDVKTVLLQVLEDRLLHQGASGTDILQQYISCIRCLQLIDPQCRVLLSVYELIEHYMTTYRCDTVAACVDMIRNGDEYDLFSLDEDDIYIFSDREMDPALRQLDRNAESNAPEPVKLKRIERRAKDLVAMLISLCKSIPNFIEGYQEKLGDALLRLENYDTDKEVITLEMLKQRFPNDALISCDIMIKDVNEGKRLDRQIHRNVAGMDPNFHALIKSKFYWPGGNQDDDEKEENQVTPSVFQNTMQQYEAEFRNIKQSRKLQWIPLQGSVELSLTFKTRTVDIIVDPISALVISLFETRDMGYTFSQVEEKLGVDAQKILDSLQFWEKQGILELLGTGVFHLVED